MMNNCLLCLCLSQNQYRESKILNARSYVDGRESTSCTHHLLAVKSGLVLGLNWAALQRPDWAGVSICVSICRTGLASPSAGVGWPFSRAAVHPLQWLPCQPRWPRPSPSPPHRAGRWPLMPCRTLESGAEVRSRGWPGPAAKVA